MFLNSWQLSDDKLYSTAYDNFWHRVRIISADTDTEDKSSDGSAEQNSSKSNTV